jgi:transposase
MPRAARLSLTEPQQKLLEKWSRGGSTPYRIVIRSKVVLLAAQGWSDRNIARRLGVNPITVARWRSRFLLLGVEGIRHEAPRLGSPPRVAESLVRSILHKTLFERPAPGVRWSTRSLARAVGVSHSTVRRVWKAHDVTPPRSLVATLARGSLFRAKSVDVVGVYINPPQRAVAISLRSEERTGRGQRPEGAPSLSNRPRPAAHAWVADLLAALHPLDDLELKGTAHRLSDSEFLSFLQSVNVRRKSREQIQLLSESSAATPSTSLIRWLHRYPEFSARIQAGGASVQQLVDEWLREASAQPLSHRPPASLPELRTAIDRWVRDSRSRPRPFVWTR